MTGDRRGADGLLTLLVLGLVVMVTWTLVIKYLAPILYAFAETHAGRPPASGAPIMWDFWWVAHLLLAWLMWRRHPRAWAAGVAIAVVEIGIVTVKFVDYLLHPDLSFWRLLWFTNKVYVLLYFIVLLFVLLVRKPWPATVPGAPS
jgi:hypothetical protein